MKKVKKSDKFHYSLTIAFLDRHVKKIHYYN